MSNELDMNIDNYELTDLLNLFKLDFNFNESDLKRSKKMVLMTHPDKSKMPKEYFLFFSSAYKVIYSIYQFRNKSDKQSTTYIPEKDEEKELLLNKLKEKPNFNKIFNELFEQNKIKDDYSENGYGDWLKSEEDIDSRTTTMSQMNETFELKKKEVKSIVVHKDIENIENYGFGNSQFDLARDKPDNYSSSLFSNLQYQDLKKAHVESVIPVTQEDYHQKQKFSNVDDLQRYNASQNNTPFSFAQAKEYLNNRNDTENKNDVNRAFKLAKQDEESRKANINWMGGFKQLT